MLYELYVFDHQMLHICFWTLPMLILGVIMIFMAIGHRHNQEKREKKFNEQMEEKLNALTFETVEKAEA